MIYKIVIGIVMLDICQATTVIYNTPKSIAVAAGREIRLPCTVIVTGVTVTTVWEEHVTSSGWRQLSTGSDIVQSHPWKTAGVVIESSHELVIPQAMRAHEGRFRCYFQQDTSTKYGAFVFVIESSCNVSVNGETRTEIEEGKIANLKCMITFQEQANQPSIQWQDSSGSVLSAQFSSPSPGTMTAQITTFITGTTEGKYTCQTTYSTPHHDFYASFTGEQYKDDVVTLTDTCVVTVTILEPTTTTASQPGNAEENVNDDDGFPLAAIIGIAIGGMVIILVVIIITCLCLRKRAREQGTTLSSLKREKHPERVSNKNQYY